MEKTTQELRDRKVFVYNVYVGNIDDDDVDAHMDKVAEKLNNFTSYDDIDVIFVPTIIQPENTIVRLN